MSPRTSPRSRATDNPAGGGHNALPHVTERVSRLETSVASIHDEVRRVEQTMNVGFRDIQQTLTQSGRTNWNAIFTGVALVIAIWAAAIRPVQSDVTRLEGAVTGLATTANANYLQIAVNTAELARLGLEMPKLRLGPDPASDVRLSVLETKLGIIPRK